MALSVETGVKLSPGSTGVQNYALPGGFGTPQALIVWASNATADGVTATAGMYAHGFATNRGGNFQTAYMSRLIDPVNTASRIVSAQQVFDAATAQELLRVFATPDSTTADWIINFNGFSSDQWSLDWTDLPTAASTRLHYIVLGGSDITDAYVGSYTAGSSATTFDATIQTGFGQPDLLFQMYPRSSATAGVLTQSAHVNLGVASDSESQACAFIDQDAAGTMVTASVLDAKASFSVNTTTPAIEFSTTLSARANWPTDGFEVTYNPNASALPAPHYYLALKGSFQKEIASTTTRTTTGDQDLAAGFTPKLGMVWGHPMPSGATLQRAAQNADATGFYLGATDGTTDHMAGVTQDDGKTTSFGRSESSTSQIMRVYGAVTPDLRVQADGSFSSTNLRLGYTTVDATARAFNWLALGDAAGAPTVTGATSGIVRSRFT